MKKLTILLAYLILTVTTVFNLWLNFPETQILADPNDNIFQYSLVARTDWVWKNYGCPWSLTCLPNLTDHNVSAWAEGYPLPFYYSHLPQIAIVSSYHLVIKPLTSLFPLPAQAGITYTLYQYYNLTKYLLLCLFPLSVFIALRIVGISPVLSALGAFFSSHFSTDGLYGIDPPSFLWRGYGLTSQLYAMIFLPIGLAFIFRFLSQSPNKLLKSPKLLILAALFLTLTTAGHLGLGIIGLLSTVPFLFFDLNFSHILKRAKKLFFIGFIVIFLLAYWIVPILLNNNYHIVSFWDPIWKFNSYGWYEAIRQYFSGEIFDWQRIPVVTVLVTIGFFAIAQNRKLFPFALLFAMWFLLYFGRTTWGGLIDLIPGMNDFHQHRFIVGIHIASLFLIPAGLNLIFNLINKGIITISNIRNKIFPRSGILDAVITHSSQTASGQNIIFYLLSFIFLSALAYKTIKQTYSYALLNNRWIYEANNAYLSNAKNFQDLVSYLKTLPSSRFYAGRPGNWGKQFRLGSSEMYMLMGINGFDVSQFLPETWSMLSENEQNFDERVAEDYDLLNIRYIVADKNHDFTPDAQLSKKFGPFELYEVPTTGWFDIVSSPMFVKSDKTNFLNIVHLWQRSYPRRWKMHPLISVEKNPQTPDGMQKVIKMTDEVSYKDLPLTNLTNLSNSSNFTQKNIFSDYPLVFPQSTPSGQIIREKVDKQTYSATVNVPDDCISCMIMFKMSYHPNWKAFIDGKEADKYAVFPYYLAVSASPGEHTVEFTYQPNRLKVILLVMEIVSIIGAGAYIFRRKIYPS